MPEPSKSASAPVEERRNGQGDQTNTNGRAHPKTVERKKHLGDDEFRTAVIAGQGRAVAIAAAIGMEVSAVYKRIRADPELKEFHGSADWTTKTDLETYRAALKVYGVSDNHLTKLAALDGLAEDGDRLLAISFRVSHQSYVGQLHNLDEVAQAIFERLRGTKMSDGTYRPLEPEEHAALAKVYADCVKERGRGMVTMMHGIEAIYRMTAASRENATGAGGSVKPGWGQMKKVRPAENLIENAAP